MHPLAQGLCWIKQVLCVAVLFGCNAFGHRCSIAGHHTSATPMQQRYSSHMLCVCVHCRFQHAVFLTVSRMDKCTGDFSFYTLCFAGNKLLVTASSNLTTPACRPWSMTQQLIALPCVKINCLMIHNQPTLLSSCCWQRQLNKQLWEPAERHRSQNMTTVCGD